MLLEGRVVSITKFGAFVEIAPGRSGLVHISEVSHTYVNDIHDVLTEGQTVKVRIIGIDPGGRVSLSIKKAIPPPSHPAPSIRPPAPRRCAPSGNPSHPSGNYHPAPPTPSDPNGF
jgi:S1 RNA binding domain protein